jgi:hypothetical protein
MDVVTSVAEFSGEQSAQAKKRKHSGQHGAYEENTFNARDVQVNAKDAEEKTPPNSAVRSVTLPESDFKQLIQTVVRIENQLAALRLELRTQSVNFEAASEKARHFDNIIDIAAEAQGHKDVGKENETEALPETSLPLKSFLLGNGAEPCPATLPIAKFKSRGGQGSNKTVAELNKLKVQRSKSVTAISKVVTVPNAKTIEEIPQVGPGDDFCIICQKKFPTTASLSSHVDSFHGRRKVYECTFCEAQFVNRSVLQIHLDEKHADKRVRCTFDGCKKTFATEAIMLSHVYKTHEMTEEEMLHCPHCPTRCKSKSSLIRHLKMCSRNPERNEMLKCAFCELRFVTSTHLQNHVRAYHQLVPNMSKTRVVTSFVTE